LEEFPFPGRGPFVSLDSPSVFAPCLLWAFCLLFLMQVLAALLVEMFVRPSAHFCHLGPPPLGSFSRAVLYRVLRTDNSSLVAAADAPDLFEVAHFAVVLMLYPPRAIRYVFVMHLEKSRFTDACFVVFLERHSTSIFSLSLPAPPLRACPSLLPCIDMLVFPVPSFRFHRDCTGIFWSDR